MNITLVCVAARISESSNARSVPVPCGYEPHTPGLPCGDPASRGVPMGGDLNKAPKNKAPTFMVRALRDPDGANLDRVQVIKGWVDASGETHERIYDVAVSDDRAIGKDGRARKPVGSTVDIEKAIYTHWLKTDQL